MKIKEVLGIALNIGTETKFKVRFMRLGETEYTKEMTYVELRMYLVKNSASIVRVDIIE